MLVVESCRGEEAVELLMLVVESCRGKEVVELLMLVANLHGEHLVEDVLELTVENIGKVGVKIHSSMEVQNYSGEEALVTKVEEVTCSCTEVGSAGKAVVELHYCSGVANAGIVVVGSCSSMEVVNTCNPVEVVDNC